MNKETKETKKLELINFIRKNIQYANTEPVETPFYFLFERLKTFSITKLEDIIEFIQKGHKLDVLGSCKEYDIPISYFRILHRLDSIEPYPFLYNEFAFKPDICNELETVLIGGYDDFMYREYATDIPKELRHLLYKYLIQGVNLTHDFDYRQYHYSEGINYVNAVMSGYNKNFAFHILRHFDASDYNRLRKLLNKGITMNDIHSKLNNKEVESGCLVLSYADQCEINELDIKKYFKYLNTHIAYRSNTFFTIIKATDENLIPSMSTRVTAYKDYISYIGGSDILELINGHYNESIELLTLIEIQLKLGINTEPYFQYTDALNWTSLVCIANGDNLLTYLAMNINDKLATIYDNYYNRHRYLNIDNILGFKILRQVDTFYN